jgi:alkanesulfonate monooxygenase SsuD/methylene tetrahydromethanopterin reductase-like flavin-dependent oxidoreductase (luciferase family)
MTDYGHALRFGVMLEPTADWGRDVLARAALIEQAGLDLVSLGDHPYWTGRLDTMSLLAAIVARTSRVTVFPDLANLPLRPPLQLARAAATLDILSGGRFELGLATGTQLMWEQISADGGPRRTASESIEALAEAVAIIRASWAGDGDVSFEGEYYQLPGAASGPKPAHGIGIWIGAYQRRLLTVTGAIADGWVPSSPAMPPGQLAAASQVIDEAATAAGRSPGDVVRVYNIACAPYEYGPGLLTGPPATWVEPLTEFALTHGMSRFVMYRVDSPELIHQFGAEVAPAVREAVAKERAAGQLSPIGWERGTSS